MPNAPARIGIEGGAGPNDTWHITCWSEQYTKLDLGATFAEYIRSDIYAEVTAECDTIYRLLQDALELVEESEWQFDTATEKHVVCTTCGAKAPNSGPDYAKRKHNSGCEKDLWRRKALNALCGAIVSKPDLRLCEPSED